MECTICFINKEMNKFTFLKCNHKFCNDCLYKYKERKNKNCPVCRLDISNDLMKFKIEEYIDNGELSESDIDTYMCI